MSESGQLHELLERLRRDAERSIDAPPVHYGPGYPPMTEFSVPVPPRDLLTVVNAARAALGGPDNKGGAEVAERAVSQHAEALRFYADPATWDEDGRAWTNPGGTPGMEADEDRGDIARAALASVSVPPQVNYTGSDLSVECAYPPCRNRLREAAVPGQPQYCSPQHRDDAHQMSVPPQDTDG